MRKEKKDELERLMLEYQTINRSNYEENKGKFLKIGQADYTLANGRVIHREELIKNNGYSSASIILPINANGDVILIVQPRVLARGGVGIELPAGYIDSNEDGLRAAKRELLEETGCIAKEFIKLAEYHQDQGCSRSINECFLATGCQKIMNQQLDSDEMISLFNCTYEEMLELMDLNYINDAGSIITIERSKSILQR